MSDIEQTPEEREMQTQHVLQTALGNLKVVVDQLESLEEPESGQVEIVLEALDTAKNDLAKLVK